jgi:hypothetical protein
MPERGTWSNLATSLATLEARVRREAITNTGAVASRRDAVRRAYVRAVLAIDALRSAPSPAVAPTPAAMQRLVHRLVDSLDEDESPWLALTCVQRITRGSRVLETHAVNVAVLAVATARALGLPRTAQAEIGLAALVHDVRQTDTVSAGERHDVDGAAWLLEWAPVDCGIKVAAITAAHRGGGDGEASRGSNATADIATRIVRIADAFDVLAGRDGPAGSPHLVLAFLLQGTGARFDAALLKVFARVVGIYPPGTGVRLRDGAIAVVVRPNRRRDGLDRPTVRVVKDAGGHDVTAEVILDLAATGDDIVATTDLAVHGVDPATLVLDR